MRIALDPRNPELRRVVVEARRKPRLQFIRTADNLARGAAAQGGAKTGSSAGVYQPLDADLTAIAALTSAADKLPYATSAQAWALADLTAAARTVLDDATVGAMLTTLGAQPLDADLTALAGLAATAGMLARTGAGAFAVRTLTAGAGITVANGDGASTAPLIAMAGNMPMALRTLNASTTLGTTDCVLIVTLSGATTAVLTLPAVSNTGLVLMFRRTDVDFFSTCTIAPAGTEQWEGVGSATYTLAAAGMVVIVSDGTSWWILSQS